MGQGRFPGQFEQGVSSESDGGHRNVPELTTVGTIDRRARRPHLHRQFVGEIRFSTYTADHSAVDGSGGTRTCRISHLWRE